MVAVVDFSGHSGGRQDKTLSASGSANKLLAQIGGYWIGITYYSFLAWVCVDALRFGFAWLDFLPGSLANPPVIGLLIWSAVFLLLVYGTWNANRPVIRHYQITIAKPESNLRRLSAVLVSDVHLGPIVATRQLAALVGLANQLDPDIVFFVGDTIDENVTYFIDQKMPEILRQLKSKYGVFAVLGNHEYIGGQSERAITALESAGIMVLRDNYVNIVDSLYIVGRDDRSRGRFTGVPRAPLATILADIDPSLPVILLDHQPGDHEEAQQQGVDLQLSGHTHRGQFFPNNLITRQVFLVDWGYLCQKSLQIIVSAGYGTWGPPIRIGNRPEMVHISIDFTD